MPRPRSKHPRRHSMTPTRVLLFGALLCFTATATAGICRWKDASGQVHYSDTAPPGIQCEGTVHAPAQPAPAASPDSGKRKSYQELDMEFRKRRLDKLEEEKKKEEQRERAEQMKAACDTARSRVAGLQAGGRVAKYDANGEIHYLDDNEIAKELAAAQQAVKDACK
ncbi:MAG: DUF4124 domain-containing protein [Betaproteobacteria bacterium]|nr:DUF4124 domain-containing protein [Betaproteobacteria bacterium]